MDVTELLFRDQGGTSKEYSRRGVWFCVKEVCRRFQNAQNNKNEAIKIYNQLMIIYKQRLYIIYSSILE